MRLLLLMIMTGLTIGLAAQSVYGPVDRRDALIGGGGLGLFVTGAIWTNKMAPSLPEDIYDLQPRRDRIWGLDRWVTNNWSPRAAKVSDGLLLSSLGLPATLLLDASTRDHFGRHGLIAAESLLLTTAITQLTKLSVHRPRPYCFNPDVALPYKLEPDARFSFFSGHTSLVACMSFTTATMYTDLSPGNNWDAAVWTTAAVLPALTGYLRVRAGKHYVSDVLIGYGVGALIGILVPRFHR